MKKFSVLAPLAAAPMYGAYYKFTSPTQVGKFFPLSPVVAPIVTTFESTASRFVYNPWVSPDQTKILYIMTDASFRQNLWIYNIATTAKTQLTTAVSSATQVFNPRWHPDSTKIVFTTNNETQIDRINVDGTGRVTLKSGISPTSLLPKYNFDGTLIAYFANNTISSGRDLHVMNADGSGDTNIKTDASDSGGRINFAWANLSNKIAYVNLGNSVSNLKHLRRINSNGSGDIALTSGSNSWVPKIASEAWTLDDAYVMYNTTLGGLGDSIYRIASDGSLTTISSSIAGLTTTGSGLPQVLPDGRVYFSRRIASNSYSMVSMLPDGTDVQEIEAPVSTDRYGIEDSTT